MLLVILILGILLINRRQSRAKVDAVQIHTGDTKEFKSAESGNLGGAMQLSKLLVIKPLYSLLGELKNCRTMYFVFNK